MEAKIENEADLERRYGIVSYEDSYNLGDFLDIECSDLRECHGSNLDLTKKSSGYHKATPNFSISKVDKVY
jgi:hypothetical protein